MLSGVPRCARCGRPAVIELASGERLCERCLASSVRQRFLAWLRKPKLRPSDSFLLVYRGDAQSCITAKLLYEVEREYGSKIEVIEVGPEPSFARACGLPVPVREFVRAEWRTYTELRLGLVKALSRLRVGSVVVMPDALEDIAAYTLGEVLLGEIEGLSLDLEYRVAYPLAAVSLKEVQLAFPDLPAKWGFPTLNRHASGLLQELSVSTPTVYFSLLSSFVELTSALKRKKGIKGAD